MTMHSNHLRTSNTRDVTINKGFTIVELLIVIVVIAILAAVTIVAFNGVQQRARESILKVDLASAIKVLENDLTVTGSYPVSLGVASGGKGLTPSEGVSYQYTADNIESMPSYCLTGSYGKITYFVSSTNKSVLSNGYCPGHEDDTALPTVVEVVHANPPGNTTTSYPVTTELQPTDLLFIIMSKRYIGSVTITGYGTTCSSFYSSSLYTGSTAMYACKLTGLTGTGSLSFKVPSTALNSTYASIFIIRGVKNPDTVVSERAGWGQKPNRNTQTPASLTADRKQIAIFTGVAYHSTTEFLVSPQPTNGWVTATTGLKDDKHSAAYYIPTEPTSVQASMKAVSNSYTADTMFVIGSP